MIAHPLLEEARTLKKPANYFRGRSYADVCLVNNVIFFTRTSRSELQKATFEMRPHHRFVLIFNLQTPGIVRVDGLPQRIEPGQGLMLLPFQFHTFPETAAEAMLWLFLTFETDRPELLENFRSKVFPVEKEALDEMSALLRGYITTSGEDFNQRIGLEASRLLVRLRSLVRLVVPRRASGDRRSHELLNAVESRLRSAKGRLVAIGELAAYLHISDSRLRSRFRSAFGLSLGSYLRNYRLHRAIELMRDTRINLSEIADNLGFADSAAFTRFFRTQSGSTPSAYRRGIFKTAP